MSCLPSLLLRLPSSRSTTDPTTWLADAHHDQNDGLEFQSIILSLPAELLVRILSFLTARDKVILLYVSRKLRNVSQTPSLWREFVWPYYHTGDEGCVKTVLNVFGKHMKRLSFPHQCHHVTSPTSMVEYCSNLIEISLPTAELHPEQLVHMPKQLQKVDFKCYYENIKHLPTAIVGAAMSIREITIRVAKHHANSTLVLQSQIEPCMNDWVLNGFVPKNFNIVTDEQSSFMFHLWCSWMSLNCKSPPGCTGRVKVYTNKKTPLNLCPVLPVFQLDFGQEIVSPLVSASSVGLDLVGDLLLLTNDCSSRPYRAIVSKTFFLAKHNCRDIQVYYNITDVQSIAEFHLPDCELLSKHLVQLAIACPNLRRLNINHNKSCLSSLQGLRIITDSCHNLQGLNLLGIAEYEVEDVVQLWQILSDMRLTHLAVELCVLQTPDEADKQIMIRYFHRCTHLQALELYCCHSMHLYGSNNDRNIKVLSHFPSLLHCVLEVAIDRCYDTIAQDLLNTCKELNYLNYSTYHFNQSLTIFCHCNLQQLCMDCCNTEISNTFMKAISSHGALVHVVLYVSSVTSDGIAILITNSPNLIAFHIFVGSAVYDSKRVKIPVEKVVTKISRSFSQRQLFISGSFTIQSITLNHLNRQICISQSCSPDLMSLWAVDVKTEKL